MKINVAYDFLPKKPSSHASLVMDHFGIGFETGQHVIADGIELPVEPGDVVLFTGSSGSGKSSLMRAVAEALDSDSGDLESQGATGSASADESRGNNHVGWHALTNGKGVVEQLPRPSKSQGVPPSRETLTPALSQREKTVLNIDTLELGTNILVDSLELPIEQSMQLLSACGLGEAQLLLRTPIELSDGQRYRFRLAMALSKKPDWILADEFTATLDRTLAKVVAFNIRRHATRTNTGFLLATTHEDIIEDLQPSLHVRPSLDGEIVYDRLEVKKKVSALPPNCKSPPRPKRTGRTSLGGITEVTTSASQGS